MNRNPIAPVPLYPEKGYPYYEAKMASNLPGERGPLRFEEGLATDPDVPADFSVGAGVGEALPGRMNRNRKVDTKYAEETMKQRLHAGSAAWITAPTVLQEMAQGSYDGANEPFYPQVQNDGRRQQRLAPTVVR